MSLYLESRSRKSSYQIRVDVARALAGDFDAPIDHARHTFIRNDTNLSGSESIGTVGAVVSTESDANAATDVSAAADDDGEGGDGDPDADRRPISCHLPHNTNRKTRRPASTTARPLPETGFVRLPQILAVIPIGKSTWWAGCKTGRYPAPIRLSPRITVWRAEDIHALIKMA